MLCIARFECKTDRVIAGFFFLECARVYDPGFWATIADLSAIGMRHMHMEVGMCVHARIWKFAVEALK